MFEARLEQGNLLKKVIEAIKDLVTDANLECTPEALSLQASKRTAVRAHRPRRAGRGRAGKRRTALSAVLAARIASRLTCTAVRARCDVCAHTCTSLRA